MAIYHASTKPVARSSGRSAVAAAAYRSGQELVDERTGLVHDYTRKGGVVFAEAALRDGSTIDRGDLWNAAEFAEKRKDSRTAREWIIALPAELDAKDRVSLAREFGSELAKRYGVAVDVAVHLPDRDGDNRNHHAHILTTTREVSLGDDGELVLGAKTVIELSDSDRRKLSLGPAADEVKAIRGLWEDLANRSLERAGRSERIDGRSLEAQGLDREPMTHLGPTATEMERRGVESDRGADNRQAQINSEERQRVGAELIDLQAERDRRELERLKTLTSKEIRREIELIRPLPFEKAVERHPKMLAAREAKDDVAYDLGKAESLVIGLGDQIEAWRKAHPIMASLHDIGLLKDKGILEKQAMQKEAAERAVVLTRADQAAGMAMVHLGPEVEAEVFRAQAPVRAKIEEMEKLAAQKHAQEMEVQEREMKVERVLQKFNSAAILRRHGAPEYSNSGDVWQDIPDPMKQLLTDYNQLSDLEQAQTRAILRGHMMTDDRIFQHMHAIFNQDRGRERGLGWAWDIGMER